MREITKIETVYRNLIDGLTDQYTRQQKQFIKRRLEEIAKENNLTLNQLDGYCYMNSDAMFSCIFDYKPFDVADFAF
jgi:hypothetical protein